MSKTPCTDSQFRSSLLKSLEAVEGFQRYWQILSIPKSFNNARIALAEDDYNIVICGEVKRGKSSFINALIGKDLLPVGVKETTSQVFRISASSSESFALIFDDGNREAITREQLVKYGSQVAADMEGQPMFRGRTLKWIEVNTPCAFLPDGVHLVDTPGLGALYAAHSEITNRYITQADAVIFVLDSGQPLTQPEKTFLDRCMEITPNILFIQTKIDTKSEAEWKKIRARNEELLNAAFHREGRPKFRVFPVASTLLADAARESDEKERAYLLEDSLFDKARKGLELVMFRATGWTRCAWAAAEATRFVEQCRRSLEEQLKVLMTESAGEKDDLRKKKAEVRASFQNQWGATGAKRTQFLHEVGKTLNGVRTSANAIGAIGTDLYSRFINEINGLATLEQVKAYANDLPEKVQAASAKEWQELILAAQSQIAALDKSLPMIPDGQQPLYVNLPRVTVRDPSLWDRIKSTNIDGMVGGSLAALAAGFFLTGGLATAAVAIGALVGASKGYEKIMNQQLDGAKNELRQHMHALLGRCRTALCVPDMAHGNPTARVDAFIEETQARVKATLEDQYLAHKSGLEEQERKLEEQAALTGEKRTAEIAATQDKLKEIAGIQDRLKGTVDQLRVMQDELNRAEEAL